MDLFLRYTKTHKMVSDAVYEEHALGGTKEKPHVFRVRIGSHVLGYGRGATRDEAIDHAIRASFYLVQAHGYDTNHVLDMNEDCLTKEPEAPAVVIRAPPPPPPLGPPPSSSSMSAASAPVIVQQPTAIPQPKMLSSTIAAPTATTKASNPVHIAIVAASANASGINAGTANKLSSMSSSMVFQGEGDECMEEKRARLPRYSVCLTTAS